MTEAPKDLPFISETLYIFTIPILTIEQKLIKHIPHCETSLSIFLLKLKNIILWLFPTLT